MEEGDEDVDDEAQGRYLGDGRARGESGAE